MGILPNQNNVRKTMTFQEIKDHESEALCGGDGNNSTTTTTKYYRYAYAYKSRYSNNATQNIDSFNVSGNNSSGAVLIGYQAGYTTLGV
jgi:hypothetical protein